VGTSKNYVKGEQAFTELNKYLKNVNGTIPASRKYKIDEYEIHEMNSATEG
jgi:hypothetical protein